MPTDCRLAGPGRSGGPSSKGMRGRPGSWDAWAERPRSQVGQDV
jgi:hypothetical protein